MSYQFFSLFCYLLLTITACAPSKGEATVDSNKVSERNTQITPSNTFHPLMLSVDYGQTWKDVSQGLDPNIQVSFLEKLGEEIVMATDNMGLYISSEKRSQWKRVGNELPNQKINALHIADKNMYVGVYRSGIYESKDGGNTWTSIIHDLPNQNVQAICRVGSKLFAGTDAGIFYLNEGEKSWNASNIQSQIVSIYEFEGRMIGGTSQGTILSEDMGNTWKWIRKEGAVHYTHPMGTRIIELVLSGDLVYSDDWGESWTQTIYQPKFGSYVYEVCEIGSYQLLSNNYGIHRSVDQGLNWNLIYPTESMAFFDLLVFGDEIYGGMRQWDEFRKRGQ